jgi:tetratricopeptide (TPR) repeat protein
MLPIVFLALITAIAHAQSGIAAVEGVVKGFDGKPLAGATLVFLDSATGGKYLLKTEPNGFYFGGNVRAGIYTVTVVSAEGEQLWRRQNIEVVQGSRGSTAFLNKYDIDLAQARAKAEKEGRSLVDPAQLSSAKAAAQAASAAARLQDAHIAAKLTAAEVAEQNHDFALGERLLQEAVALRPDAGSLWASIALLRIRAGSSTRDDLAAQQWYESSLTASDKALTLEPGTGAYLNNKAEALGRLHRFDEALHAYGEAVAANDGDAALYRANRGLLLTRESLSEPDVDRKRSLLSRANAEFDLAVKLDPTLADALFQKAVNQLSFADPRTGNVQDPKATVEALRRYLVLAPNGKHAAEARDLIAQLQK